MSSFLARNITTSKWKIQGVGRNRVKPPDGLTNDMRVMDGCLSFWTCDPALTSSLNDIVTAFAATRERVDRVDLAWIEETAITKNKLIISATDSDTPAIKLRFRHRDIKNLSMNRVYNLAREISRAVNKADLYSHIWTRKEVLDLLIDAAQRNELNLDLAKEKLVSELRAAALKQGITI